MKKTQLKRLPGGLVGSEAEPSISRLRAAWKASTSAPECIDSSYHTNTRPNSNSSSRVEQMQDLYI